MQWTGWCCTEEIQSPIMKRGILLFLLTYLISNRQTHSFTSIVPNVNKLTLHLLNRPSLNQPSLNQPTLKRISPLEALPSTKEAKTSDNQKAGTKRLVDQSTISNEISADDEEMNEDELFSGVPKATAASLSLLLFAQFVLFIGVGAVIPTIPLYGKEIGLSSAANGIVISAPALALLLLARPAGQYSDLARKPALLWGMLVIALSDLGTALAQSIVPLIIARLGLGAGRCISESGERGMLADLAGTIPELRGRALSIQQAVIALGIAIGAPAGGFVVEEYGPRAAFLCVTAAAFLNLLLYSFLPETLEGSKSSKSPLSRKNGNFEEKVEMIESTVNWKDLLKDSRWRGLSLFEIGARFGYAAKLASIPILATSLLPGGAIGAGALLSAAGLSGLVGAPIGGYFSDRIGAKNTILLTGLFSGVGLILIPFSLQISSPEYLHLPDGAAFSASVLIWSTSVAAQNPASIAFAQEISPEGSTATAMALPRAAGDSVYLFAPFLLGLVSDAKVPVGTDCAIAGICGLLGIAALKWSTK